MSTSWPTLNLLPCDILSRALGNALINASGGIRRMDRSDELFASYLMSCQLHPGQALDPVTNTLAGSAQQPGIRAKYNALEVVLGLGTKPVYPAKVWPEHLSEFSSTSNTSVDRVAALMLAAGANAWDANISTDNVSGLPNTINDMVELRLTGVLSRALDQSGAISVQDLASRNFGSHYYNQPLVDLLVTSDDGGPMLAMLVKRGLVLDDVAQLAGQATPSSMAALNECGLLEPLAARDRKRIQGDWLKRLKNTAQATVNLSADNMEKMLSILEPGASAQDKQDSLNAANIEKILSVNWNDGKFYMRNLPPIPELLISATTTHSLRGQWSMLGAICMANVRQQASSWKGTDTIDFKDILKKGGTGCLKQAVEIEWQPGITMATPILLMLLTEGGTEAVSTRKNQEIALDAMGVPSMAQWAREHANATADFTIQTMRRNAKIQQEVMSKAWSTAISREPGLAMGLDAGRAWRLLMALSGDFRKDERSWGTQGHPVREVARLITKQLDVQTEGRALNQEVGERGMLQLVGRMIIHNLNLGEWLGSNTSLTLEDGLEEMALARVKSNQEDTEGNARIKAELLRAKAAKTGGAERKKQPRM